MRLLSEQEITILKQQGCTAEDWTAVSVSEEFRPNYIRNVSFYGEIQLGVFEKSIPAGSGFMKHSGITDATLRNAAIGDNCLIEHIGNYINNYNIGEDCFISNVAAIETTEGATFGEGTILSVLNEAGDGNVLIYSGLTAQTAALMIKYERDKDFTAKIRKLVYADIDMLNPGGSIGNRCRIVNTGTILNCAVSDDCEIDGACRLSDCSLQSRPGAPVYIGSGVICENSIICDGSCVLNSSKLENCFVGEACRIKNGFTADNCLFFANCDLSNGEACAAFCGPFTTSHHKSTLLIASAYSFYNAGSGTNFSNHAYKTGPVHYGIMQRGAKTASETHILLPSVTGQFSVCMGKIHRHPDTSDLPFSYIIGKENSCIIVPGRNIATAGLYRDTHKWRKRDKRTNIGTRSIINFEWLSPYAINGILNAKRILEELKRASGEETDCYKYKGFDIKASSLNKGIRYYDIALKLFIGETLRRNKTLVSLSDTGTKEWSDLAGMLLPLSEERRITEEIKNEGITSVNEITEKLKAVNADYNRYCVNFAVKLIREQYAADEITDEIKEKILEDYALARRERTSLIREDAYKEYALGDVSEDTLNSFLAELEREEDEKDFK